MGETEPSHQAESSGGWAAEGCPATWGPKSCSCSPIAPLDQGGGTGSPPLLLFPHSNAKTSMHGDREQGRRGQATCPTSLGRRSVQGCSPTYPARWNQKQAGECASEQLGRQAGRQPASLCSLRPLTCQSNWWASRPPHSHPAMVGQGERMTRCGQTCPSVQHLPQQLGALALGATNTEVSPTWNSTQSLTS